MPDRTERVETEYRNPYFAVSKKLVRQPDGSDSDYYTLELGDGVVAIGVHRGDVLFVELERPRLEATLLELPGGGIEDGESPTEAGRREFREETGYDPGGARLLGSFYFSAWTRAKRHVVWVDDLDPVDTDPPEWEVQGVARVPASEALSRAIDTGAEWNVTPVVLARRAGLL
jgi:ADP-ribose pyrophosphatase